MLIAYMGETFGANNEVKDKIKIKDHLSFIMDNWYLKEISLGNIKNIKYIIAAIPVSDSNDEEDAFANVERDLENMKLQIKKLAIEQTKRAISQDEMLKTILYNQDKMMHKMMN
jgi:hypothetical protein